MSNNLSLVLCACCLLAGVLLSAMVQEVASRQLVHALTIVAGLNIFRLSANKSPN